MSGRVSVPVKLVGSQKWGDLNSMGYTHQFCGEQVKCLDPKFTFAGGHRVRLYKFTKNVHWRIPDGIELDITEVVPANPPRRQTRR